MKLLAGPWLGEFGWELFGWQGVLRYLAQNNDYEEILVGCKPGREYLYADFATNFVNVEGEDRLADVCTYNRMPPKFSKDIIKAYPDHGLFTPHYKHFYDKRQTFIKFGQEGAGNYDIILHARNREIGPDRNWSIANWNNLISKLSGYSIACIGNSKVSHYLEGTTDLRDRSLEEICNELRNAKVMVSPSSGPVHLASLSGCPHVVWTDSKNRSINADTFTNRIRYESMWNPLKTRTEVIDDQLWNPSVNSVYERMVKVINENSL